MACKKYTLPNNVMEAIREGTLNLLQKGPLKKNKSYYVTLMPASQSGVARLEMYENEKHWVTLQPTAMVVGNDVVKVERLMLAAKEMRNSFLISTRDHHYTFFTKTSMECDSWVKDIQETLLGEVHGYISPKDKKMFSEFNDIYEPADNFSPQTSDFWVTIHENTRARMSVDGKVRLVVENDSIAIISTSGKMIVRWGLKDIRRYTFTNQTFFVEAGRKSSLGEGDFTFLTDEGERIHALMNKKRKMLKQKLETGTSPVARPHSTPKSVPPGPPPTCAELQPSYCKNDYIYDTVTAEDVLPSSRTKPSWVPAGNACIHPPQKVPPVEIKSDSIARPVSSYPSTKKPSTTSQGTMSLAMKQHNTKVAAKDQTLNQAEVQIYSEPQIMRDAWKSHGFNDSEETDSLYSVLSFSHPEVIDDLYWTGVRPHVDASQKKEEKVQVQEKEEKVQVEDIYAQVDFSKKCKNRK